MAVVAGVVFFAVRALLALIPALTVGYPIKKSAIRSRNGRQPQPLPQPRFIFCCPAPRSRRKDRSS